MLEIGPREGFTHFLMYILTFEKNQNFNVTPPPRSWHVSPQQRWTKAVNKTKSCIFFASPEYA